MELGASLLAAGLPPPDAAEALGFNTFGDNVLANPDARRIFHLHKYFYPLARWPRLERFILPLTKRAPGRFAHYIFVLFYVYSYRQHTGVSRLRIVAERLHWFRQFVSTMGTRR